MIGVTYRPAMLDDAAEVHALLLALAPELPLNIDSLAREEALYAEIRACARSGESWVACDASGRIIGLALAERAERGRHYAEHEVVELRHAAATAAARAAGVEERLIARLLDRLVPVIATVSPLNRTGLGDRLERLGFRAVGGPGGERQYRWRPGGVC